MAMYRCPRITESKIYGAEWAGGTSSAWTRTDAAVGFAAPSPAINNGNGSSPFDGIMPWSGLRRVTDNNVGELVEIPKFYYKWTRNGTKMKLQISEKEFDGSYVSPAHADRGDGKGERDFVYVGAYCCDYSTYKSISGVNIKSSIDRATFRTNIHNLGSDIWQNDFALWWTIRMLYLVEYADWNSGAKIGYGSNNGSMKTGLTDSMVYHTGTSAASRTAYGVVRYRYIEALWGISNWIDGIRFSNSNIYVTANPANFNDSYYGTNAGYRLAKDDQCIMAWTDPSSLVGIEYALFPKTGVTNTSYDTYTCAKYIYSSNCKTLSSGGPKNCFNLYCYSESSSSNCGSRIMKLP